MRKQTLIPRRFRHRGNTRRIPFVLYKHKRRKEECKIPKEVRRERAAVVCERTTERHVLRKQMKQAKARHAVNCCLMPGKVLAESRALKELLYSEGHLPEERAVWRDEPQRHNDEVYDDKEETAEKQEERIMKFKTIGDKHFTEEVVMDEITIEWCSELAPGWRRKQSIGQRTLLSRDDQGSPPEKVYEITRCFHARIMCRKGPATLGEQ